MRDTIVVGDSGQGQAVIVLIPHLIRVIKSSASMDRQVRAYGSVVIHTASALLIINNYETLTQAAVALRSATTATGASPQRHGVTQ